MWAFKLTKLAAANSHVFTILTRKKKRRNELKKVSAAVQFDQVKNEKKNVKQESVVFFFVWRIRKQTESCHTVIMFKYFFYWMYKWERIKFNGHYLHLLIFQANYILLQLQLILKKKQILA